MNKFEMYLAALETAVETGDEKAIQLLEGFSVYVCQELDAKCNNSSGEEHAVWVNMLNRIKNTIAKMSATVSADIW